MTVTEIQYAFRARGYDIVADGVWGRKSIAVAKELQRKAGITVDGIVGPATIAALNAMPGIGGARAPILRVATPPVWYLELARQKGLHEVRDRSRLMAWLKRDGATLGDPAKNPWCGDAVQTAIALTLPDEPLPPNPYLARNWMKFGVPLKEPALGAIAVFWRGSRTGISGHVGEYVGTRRSDGALRILGGNQSDAITEAWLGADRLLGFRWPATVPLPSSGRILLAADGGALSINEA